MLGCLRSVSRIQGYTVRQGAAMGSSRNAERVATLVAAVSIGFVISGPAVAYADPDSHGTHSDSSNDAQSSRSSGDANPDSHGRPSDSSNGAQSSGSSGDADPDSHGRPSDSSNGAQSSGSSGDAD